MARRKPIHRVLSRGVHERFDAGADALPKLVEATQRLEAAVGREFGFVLHLERARGLELAWEIDHPGVPDGGDPEGPPLAPFRGTEHVPTPVWDFYLGDALWEPLEPDGRAVADVGLAGEPGAAPGGVSGDAAGRRGAGRAAVTV